MSSWEDALLQFKTRIISVHNRMKYILKFIHYERSKKYSKNYPPKFPLEFEIWNRSYVRVNFVRLSVIILQPKTVALNFVINRVLYY